MSPRDWSRLLFALAAVALVLGVAGVAFALTGLVPPNAGWIGGSFGLAVAFALVGVVTLPRPPDDPPAPPSPPGSDLAPIRRDDR